MVCEYLSTAELLHWMTKMAPIVSEAERAAGKLTQFTQVETVLNCTKCVSMENNSTQ
jgi:hypothetical protein